MKKPATVTPPASHTTQRTFCQRSSQSEKLTRSSKANACPICGRSKDGDCRIGAESVLCWRGNSHHPPAALRSGDLVTGSDRVQWAYTGNADGWAHFTRHKPRDGALTVEDALFTFSLARLPEPAPQPPARWPDRHRLRYSPSQILVVRVENEEKSYIAKHQQGSNLAKGAGPDPWPLWREAEALKHGRGRWISEAEGEKCADWLAAAGLVAISQPGHAHTPGAIEARYRALLAAGVQGVAYLADNDQRGREKADRCAAAAAAAGLPFRIIHAAAVWPGIPEKGSIDDAPGTAIERAADFELSAGQAQQQEPSRAPQGEPQASRKPRSDLTSQEKLQALREHAGALLARGEPFADRLPLMRERAASLDARVKDFELRRYLLDARRAAAGTIEPLGPGDQIDLTPSPWHWDGVVMAGCFNLLLALPKVGKTSLLLALLGAWHRGERSFLGLNLIGPCPPVLIVGTDQPSQDWGRMLKDVDLLGEAGIKEQIVGLFYKGRPLHLDSEGIERIASYAADHRGLLVVLDSIAACTGPLGLDENSAEIVEPLNDLMEAIEPHGATLVAIHHSSKGRAGESPAMASRGSTALPAAASQIISLSRVTSAPPGPKDPLILLKTEGRGGKSQELLIERTDLGWISHGSAEAVAHAQHMRKVENKLGDRQQEALEFVRERWAQGERTDAATLAPLMGTSDSSERGARRTLDTLVRKGLLTSVLESHATGRRKFWWPVGFEPEMTPSRVGLETRPDLSDLSDPVSETTGPDPLGSKRSDRSDGKVHPYRPTRKSVQTPRQKPDGSPGDLKGWRPAGCPSAQPSLPLPIETGLIGSCADAMDDEDDPHWGPRPGAEAA